MENVSSQNRNLMTGIAIIIGVTMLYVIPFMVQSSLEQVLFYLNKHINEGYPAFKSGLKLFDFFFPAWRTLIFAGGATLIVISPEIKKGSRWTYPLALSMFALPAIGGFFMFLPHISWVPGFPLPIVISFIGLIGYWAFILLRDDKELKIRLVQMAALTFIGMLITHAFTIGVGAQRTLATRPNWPFYPDFSWWLFLLAGEVNWVAALTLYISIPYLALKKKAGWWMAVIATITILFINVPTQFVRTKTLDYLYGSLLALGVLIFTMYPPFKARLLEEPLPEKTAPPTD